MPRSSRHKSSKHSSRESRDYSDSEKDSGLKEKKVRDDGGSSIGSRHLKESGEKRKLETKSVDIVKENSLIGVVAGGVGNANVEYIDEYGPSSSLSVKKRKEKVDDDRWTGGDSNIEVELSKSEMKEVRNSSDSKRSSRRDENVGLAFDGEEGKRSGSKVESKHHRSERKEKSEKDGGSERERKGSKSEKMVVDGVLGTEHIGSDGNKKQGGSGEERGGKHAVGNTEFHIQDDVRNPESEREVDRRVRRKRDGSGDVDKHQDGVREPDDRRLSSREDIAKSGRYKDESHKDDRIREKYREDTDKDNAHQDEKQRDSRPSKDYATGRSDEKPLKSEKKDLDVSVKKSKPHHSEYERDRDRERDRDHDRDRDRERDRDRSRHDHERDRDRDHDERDNDLDRDRDRERDLERGHDRDRELDRDRERGRDRYRRERERDRLRDRDHNHDRGRDRDYDHDHDYGSHIDDKGSRYKEERGRRRSPDGYDEYHGEKARRVESEADKERSLSRKTRVDSVTSSSRRRASPSSRSYAGSEKYRDGMQDDMKYGDSLRDVTSMSEAVEKVPKYRSGEKRTKFDDNHVGELPDRSPSTKASPAANLKERSPSSTSVDRRFRAGRRRSLDVDEAERRSSGSNDMRDVSVNEDRQGRDQGRDFSSKKPMGEDYPRAESPFYHKSSQINVSSHGPGPSGFRSGADSPSFIGSMGEDSRGNSGSRFRRNADHNMGRGPGNTWKGVHNWPSPLPNGFMPFPPGPPGPHHGGFPPMLSQFPPMFGVRPSMEMNHPGIPYHMADADRFPGHVRPIGWPNMVDGSVPPHFHGWDANNGVLREESSMYGSGHMSSARGRDTNSDMWKPNGDVNMDVNSGSQKDAPMVKASVDEASSAQVASRVHHESGSLDDYGASLKKSAPSGPSSTKDIPMTPTKMTTEKTPESISVDDTASYLRTYLATLDISINLADPELYNQCINIGVKGDTDSVEDVEVDFIEEKAAGEPEITNLTMGLTIFPAAKDSIFQRAMALYKTQSTERRSSAICNGEKLHSPPVDEASQLEVNQIFVASEADEQTDGPADYSVKPEDSTMVVVEETVAEEMVAEEVVPTSGEEVKDPVSITSNEGLNSVPSLQTADLTPDAVEETGTPIPSVEPMEEEISRDLVPENVDKGPLDAIDSIGDTDMVGSDGKTGDAEPASDELLDVAVSGPLILSNDSVKACEALVPVSNESESVILSRIHHAPESTH